MTTASDIQGRRVCLKFTHSGEAAAAVVSRGRVDGRRRDLTDCRRPSPWRQCDTGSICALLGLFSYRCESICPPWNISLQFSFRVDSKVAKSCALFSRFIRFPEFCKTSFHSCGATYRLISVMLSLLNRGFLLLKMLITASQSSTLQCRQSQ